MKNKKIVLFSVTFVVILFISLHYVGWLNPIEIFIKSLFNPIISKIYSVSVGINILDSPLRKELNEDYIKIQSEMQNLQVERASCALLKDENYQLRQQLNFLNENSYQSVGARVIGRNLDPLGSVLMINRGADAGLELNQPAIVGSGVLVGIISAVDRKTSSIRLINDSQSKIAATLINKDRSIGLVEGGFGISIKMNMIPQNESVAIDDLVITSGLSSAIPKGLIIGTVESVERESYQPFQKAIIKPTAVLDKISDVSIIIGTRYEDN